jgi:isoquinoline 1-oxidoreductase
MNSEYLLHLTSTEVIDDEELQQHECAPLWAPFQLERRDFFKLFGCGLLIGFSLRAGAQEAGRAGGRRAEEQVPNDVDSWLHIADDGRVTVFTGKAEVGQNIRTALAQQVAEELRVPLDSVHMQMADTALTPFDMGTFGSRTTPQMGTRLREVSARARELLVAMAARQWGVSSAGLVAANARVTNPATQHSLSYAELTRGKRLAARMPASSRQPASAANGSAGNATKGAIAGESIAAEATALEPAIDWRVAGQPLGKVNGREFVTGTHQYTSDMHIAGMLHGEVLRPPAFKAKLTSLDAHAAEAIPDVKVVRDGDFVGVVAPDQHTASRALGLLHAAWQRSNQISERELFSYLRNVAAKSDEEGEKRESGSVAQGRAQAAHTLAQTYTVAYIAHAPLEPRAALAHWQEGRLTVWTGSQRPFGVRDQLAEAFRLPVESVRVIVPDTGAAYGGKHTGEAAIEAARLAKGAGRPVRLIWSREEEFTWAYFRPAGVIDISSGIGADRKLAFWEHDNYNSGPSAMDTPYSVAHKRVEFHPVDSPLRQASYRALAATANHFARESHMDELAHLVGIDPLEFRLRNLDDERLRAVFQAAADKFGWAREKSSPARGFGIAGGIEKGGRIATCAEVAVDHAARNVRIVRVVEAFDCGAVVNPEGLRNQIAGAIVMGIGGALFEAIHFDNGRILNPHFAEYRVPRQRDVPQIEVVLVDRKDQPPAGAGETPIVGIAPATANAIFASTGLRLRSMPLVPNGLPT